MNICSKSSLFTIVINRQYRLIRYTTCWRFCINLVLNIKCFIRKITSIILCFYINTSYKANITQILQICSIIIICIFIQSNVDIHCCTIYLDKFALAGLLFCASCCCRAPLCICTNRLIGIYIPFIIFYTIHKECKICLLT